MVCAADRCPHRGAIDGQHDGHVSLRTGTSDMGLLDVLGVNTSVFPPVRDNGNVIARLGKELASKIGTAMNGHLCSWRRMTPLGHGSDLRSPQLRSTRTAFCRRAHGRSPASSWMPNRHKGRVGCRLHERGGIG